MTYRSDADALEARLGNLERDLAAKTVERDEIARMLDEARHRDAAMRWMEDAPRRRRRRRMFAGIVSAMLLIGGFATWRVMRRESHRDHDERIVQQIERFTDDMCRCTDKACADKVSNAFTEWGAQMAKDEYRDTKPDEALMRRVADVVKRYADCMTKLMTTEPMSSPSR